MIHTVKTMDISSGVGPLGFATWGFAICAKIIFLSLSNLPWLVPPQLSSLAKFKCDTLSCEGTASLRKLAACCILPQGAAADWMGWGLGLFAAAARCVCVVLLQSQAAPDMPQQSRVQK